MRAPPRPRFQRPKTQLVHLLLDVQPPARVAGLALAARSSLDVNSVDSFPYEDTKITYVQYIVAGERDFGSEKLRVSILRRLIGSYYHHDHRRTLTIERDCTFGGKNTRARARSEDVIIFINKGAFRRHAERSLRSHMSYLDRR